MKFIYIAILGSVFFLAGCGAEEEVKTGQPEASVYLAVTRAHVDGLESLNEDGTDYEDRVYDLAMLVFDSNTGARVAEYFDAGISAAKTDETYTVKLTPGNRNFYFVANMPMQDLKSITTNDVMDTYMRSLRDLDTDLYHAATSSKAFPMSRVYMNQVIGTNGTVESPLPFRPDGEDRVKLIRSVAKLDVYLQGFTDVEEIIYHNASGHFTLQEIAGQAPQKYHPSQGLNQKTKDVHYIYYMPEVRMPGGTAWASDAAHKPVNYFTIKVKGTTFEIPVITTDKLLPAGDYLSFARGEMAEKPDYSIFRNHRYVYTFTRPQNNIEIYYNVLPWDVVTKSLFMGYWYNVEIEGDNVKISNTINACPPHDVLLKTVNGFTFSDGLTEKTFNDVNYPKEEEFTLNKQPDTGDGDYLEVWYNGIKVKTFSI